MKRISYTSLLFVMSILLNWGCSSTGGGPDRTFRHPAPANLDSNIIIPPAWSFGVLYGGYTNQEETIKRIKKIREHDYPIDAYWIDSWFWSYDDQGIGPHKYIDFVADTTAYPDREAMWSFMEKHNIKGGFWVWDCIQKTGNEEAFEDFKERGFFRNIYNNTNPWHNKSTSTAMHIEGENDQQGTPTGNIDFENPEAAAYFKKRMKPLMDEGADFIKLDRTSAIPVTRTMFEITQELGHETEGRGFILAHTGGMDSEEYKRYPAKWTDDTRMDWTVEEPTKDFHSWVPRVAFKENIAMFTDPDSRHSEVPFMTQDLGGFDMGITDELDEELYHRWMQFAIFSPITEVFTQPENPTANMPYNYSENADSLFRKYAHLRMKLFPYIYSYAKRMRLESQHIIGKFPNHIYQYMFGDQLLIAPVYKQEEISREVFLPQGTWTNFWSGEQIKGGRTVETYAPTSQIPVFVKQGAIIPMREYASSIETGSNDKLHIHLYPGADGTFTLIEDDGISNDYMEGIYAKTEMHLKTKGNQAILTIDPLLGYYDNMQEQRTWIFHIHHPEPLGEMLINGEKISFSKNGETIVSSEFSNSKYEETQVVINY